MLLVNASFLLFALCVFMLRKLCEKKTNLFMLLSLWNSLVIQLFTCEFTSNIRMLFTQKKKDEEKTRWNEIILVGVYFSISSKNIMTSKCRSNLKCMFSLISLQLTQTASVDRPPWKDCISIYIGSCQFGTAKRSTCSSQTIYGRTDWHQLRYSRAFRYGLLFALNVICIKFHWK